MNTATEIVTNAKLQDTVWGKQIIKAEQYGHFPSHAMYKAGEWCGCAVGELEEEISRDDYSFAPNDKMLNRLGQHFNMHVRNHKVVDAAKTLVEIHARAKVLASIN